MQGLLPVNGLNIKLNKIKYFRYTCKKNFDQTLFFLFKLTKGLLSQPFYDVSIYCISRVHSRPSYHKIFNILRCTQKIKQYLLNSNVVYIFYEHCIQAFLFCFYKLLKRSLIFCQGVVSMLNNTNYWK